MHGGSRLTFGGRRASVVRGIRLLQNNAAHPPVDRLLTDLPVPGYYSGRIHDRRPGRGRPGHAALALPAGNEAREAYCKLAGLLLAAGPFEEPVYAH